MVTTQPMSRYPFLRPRHVVPQVCPSTACSPCWCDQPTDARSARLRPLEQGTPCPGCAQRKLQDVLCATTACLDRREHGRHEEQGRLYTVHVEQAPFQIWDQEVRTMRCRFRLCDTRGTVCRERFSSAVWDGSGAWSSDGLDAESEPYQQGISSLHWQFLHKASVGSSLVYRRNPPDMHRPWQLERHPCDTEPSSWRVSRLPPRGHAVRCIPREEVAAETGPDAEHEGSGWCVRRPHCSGTYETQAELHHRL